MFSIQVILSVAFLVASHPQPTVSVLLSKHTPDVNLKAKIGLGQEKENNNSRSNICT